MSLLDELKQKLEDFGIIEVYEDDDDDDVSFCGGFWHCVPDEKWIQVCTKKDNYESYKINPTPYECEPGLSYEEFMDNYYGNRDEADEYEELDEENIEITDFEVLPDKIIIKVDCGGDWQIPHSVEITYFGGDKFEVKDLGSCRQTYGEGKKDTKDFLDLLGYK